MDIFILSKYEKKKLINFIILNQLKYENYKFNL